MRYFKIWILHITFSQQPHFQSWQKMDEIKSTNSTCTVALASCGAPSECKAIGFECAVEKFVGAKEREKFSLKNNL